MNQVKIAEGHQHVMPYIIIKNANGFLSFTKNVFGAKEQHKSMRDEQTIMHAEVMIGNSTIMFADAIPDWGEQMAGLFIYVDNTDDVYKKALEAGAKSIMPIEDKDYGRTCGIIDPHGITWWITSLNTKS